MNSTAKIIYNKSAKIFKNIEMTFDRFDTTISNYLKKSLGELGQNYGSNNIYTIIFRGIGGIMQNALFYIEDALSEQNIYTAVRKKSLYSLARLSGYQPCYGNTATGSIIARIRTNYLPQSVSPKLYIKDKSVLSNTMNGLKYTLFLPTDEYIIDLSKPLRSHQFKVVQGTYSEYKYTSTGKLFETFNIDISGFYDKEYTKVFVNGKEWTRFLSLYDMNETDTGYIINTGFDTTFEISFGNGVHGMLLKEGDAVSVKYLSHNGEDGNIASTGNVFKFETPVTNAVGENINADDYLSFSQDTIISGGTNADTIEYIRKTIGFTSRSNVLASEDNFKQFLKQFSFIGQTTIFSHHGSMRYVACCLNNKQQQLVSTGDYLSLTLKDLLLTEEQKSIVLTSLEKSNKIFSGATFSFIDPIIARYSMICYVKTSSVYNRDGVEESIRNTVGSYFMNLDENTDFISKSDIITEVVANDHNIESFDFDFISELDEKAYKDNFYEDYKVVHINNEWQFEPVKHVYESTVHRGLDSYGNIQLPSKLYIPLMCGGFRYYTDKQNNNKTDCVTTKSIEIYFI